MMGRFYSSRRSGVSARPPAAAWTSPDRGVRLRAWPALAVAVICTAGVVHAQTPPTRAVEESSQLAVEYRVREDLARGMTERLLEELIDGQLQRIRDNNLTELPLYEELCGIRRRVADISSVQMAVVVETLGNAATASGDEQTQLFAKAREQMHSILTRLIAERELIRAHNQHAALIQRIGEIIAGQKKAWELTRNAYDANEEQVIAAADSQATTEVLFEEFEKTLVTISDWGGDLGSVASKTRVILVTSGVAKELDDAVVRIEQLQLSEAAALQEEILTDLERIEIEIRKLEDPAWIGNDLTRAINELIAEQEQVRSKTRNITAADVFTVLEQQSLVQEKLGRLVAKVGWNERAIMLASRAEDSAAGALQEILDDKVGKGSVSDEHQGNVIGWLEELKDELEFQDGLFDGAKSAREFFALAKQMEEMKRLLLEVRKTHAKTVDRFTVSPLESKASIADTVSLLETLEIGQSTPPAVTRRVETANSFLKDLSEGAAEPSREFLRLADHLIRFAVGETAQAGRDAALKARAVKIGELNRAAESLSRAFGALRDELYLLRTGTARLGELTCQERVEITAAISEKVAEGTKELAPEAVAPLKSAIEETQALVDLIDTTPAEGETTLANQFRKSASALERAAVELRTEMIFSAGDLESIVAAELERVAELEAELKALAGQPEFPEPEVLAEKGDVVMQRYAAIGAALCTAADTKQNDPKQAVREMERALVLVLIERQELEELLAMIQDLVEQSRMQQAAAAMLVDARNQFEGQDPNDGQDPEDGQDPKDGNNVEPGESVDKEQLARAFENFVHSLTNIGETARELTQQAELGNQPLKEAGQLASNLRPQIEGGDPMDPPESGNDPSEPGSDPSAPGPSEPSDESGAPMPGDGATPSEGVAPSDNPGDGPPSKQPGDGPPGTQPGDGPPGMQPGDPMSTAQLLAGTTLSEMAGNMPSMMEAADSRGSRVRSKAATNDPKQQAGRSNQDIDGLDRHNAGPLPWTAGLPEEIRSSMRSSSKRELPKYYENQLKAYFQTFNP